ncbi:MAG: 3-ketoacyl-CoA thiolase [Anaerolineae bacterium]|nr:3-ketoacyl-CoA thiolase [Anaerolineae bacterium]RIK21609.1 MAG: thiolase domain-containing protein [Chloroflexota bacterium]
MRDVSIIGIGQTPVREHWEKDLRQLATAAVLAALQDAHVDQVDAIYVGNMLSGELTRQEHLGALIADQLGMSGVAAMKVEAACGAGGSAVHAGYLAIASGQYRRVAVVGVEKMTDLWNGSVTAGLAMAADGEYEAANGISFVGLNALMMRRYMYEYDLVEEDFAPFALNAHKNAVHNPNAMFRKSVTLEQFTKAKKVADPISLFDASPVCDGAAALILSRSENLNGNAARAVAIQASALATDTLALHDRQDPLWLRAVELSSIKAYAQAGVTPQDINLFELHDAFSIVAPMSLEAAGFAPRGAGTYLARDGGISLYGKLPISTMGGLKARGHPIGASGVYQVVEATQQLRGEAGKNQVPNARIAMTQSLGGVAATAATHILKGKN